MTLTNAVGTSRSSRSWVIREKATGTVITETFDRKKVDRLNTSKYEAIPIIEYLASITSQVDPAPVIVPA